ncbi:CAP domain-containing protein [Streptomyces sp. bgisy154]|uniref:CAP domain-containing protein n=1 Tax=Streptomyces sp. bgisy154 TaxID=3413794 RepID=UPI003D76667F
MGRHRRSDAGRAATDRATGAGRPDGPFIPTPAAGEPYGGEHTARGVAPYPHQQAYADANARSEQYLFSTEGSTEDSPAAPAGNAFFPDGGRDTARTAVLPVVDGDGRPAGGHRRRRKTATPVRTGLLGVSAAVALGTVAVATGVVPGLDNYRLGGSTSTGEEVRAGDAPSNSASEQGGTSGSVERPTTTRTAGPGTGRSASPSASPSPSASASASATPSGTVSVKPSLTPTKPPAPKPTPTQTPSRTATKAPQTQPGTAFAVSAEDQAAAEVLRLVNEERAKVGCSAVSANSALAQLAQAFSEDMAARGFFDHTDPDGNTPWDRAEKAGVSGMGGENIARGQADAAAVMEAWMNSPGHRANILNCDFKTLGVGVHFGSGGPWWTQDFGY